MGLVPVNPQLILVFHRERSWARYYSSYILMTSALRPPRVSACLRTIVFYIELSVAPVMAELQRDLAQLGRWAEKWQMDFNAGKQSVPN